ncbi:MAG: glycosyltransferase family 2 protein [Flavobacteriales bacterium]|nr:glycosyltransferase family 2 protein [Flavobacteriales bacterium]
MKKKTKIEMATVSVIIPVYKAEKSIIRALDSIKNQTRKVDEIILVNDGSPDDSAMVIDKYHKENPEMNIHYFLQKNQGPSVARNKGVSMATSAYIAFLDSDDAWLPNKIEEQLVCFDQNPDLNMLAGLRAQDKGSGAFRKVNFNQLLLKNYFVTSSVMVKKQAVLDAGGFPENQKYSEDYHLWLKIAQDDSQGIIEKPLFIYAEENEKINKEGLSGQMWEMEKGELSNYQSLYSLKKIGLFKYLFLCCFSLLKYFKRRLF